MKHFTDNEQLSTLLQRLNSYPGARPNEKWKLETDLQKCSSKEKAKMQELGISIDDLTDAELNRGEVHHILFGYDATRSKCR